MWRREKPSRNAGAGPGARDAGAAGPGVKRDPCASGAFRWGCTEAFAEGSEKGSPRNAGGRSRGFVGDEIFAVAKFLARSGGMADFLV